MREQENTMVCPYSNAGYDKCYVTHVTPENKEKAYYYCGGGGQHKSCHIYPALVAKDIAALEDGRNPDCIIPAHRLGAGSKSTPE